MFDSEQSARAMVAQIQPSPDGEVTIDSVDVREVIAHA